MSQLLKSLLLAVGLTSTAFAQFGGAKALTDTQTVVNKFHAFRLQPGQHLIAAKIKVDTLSSTVPIAITSGGTSAGTASAARTALGVAIGSDVQAYDADLADLADGSLTGSKVGSGIPAGNITSGTLPNAQLDSDLQDLADGSLTGSLVGSGIPAGNITTGTLDNARLDSDLQDLADGSLTGSLVGSGIPAGNVTTGTLANARLTGSGAVTVTAGNQLTGGGSVALGSSVTVNVSEGSGSGLDADILDGQNLVSGATTASTVVGRDGSGRIQTASPSGGNDAVNLTYFNANASSGASMYYTGTYYNGSNADTACSSGYHMCKGSEWVGTTWDASASQSNGGIEYMWYDINSNLGYGVTGDCLNWSSSHSGYVGQYMTWRRSANEIITAGTTPCNAGRYVICCSDP